MSFSRALKMHSSWDASKISPYTWASIHITKWILVMPLYKYHSSTKSNNISTCKGNVYGSLSCLTHILSLMAEVVTHKWSAEVSHGQLPPKVPETVWQGICPDLANSLPQMCTIIGCKHVVSKPSKHTC